MTSTLDVPEQNQDLVLDQSADDYWNHYQLTFALYSVSDRAIPSAFDGLKPGQRRRCAESTRNCCPATSRRNPRRSVRRSPVTCTRRRVDVRRRGAVAAEFQRVKVIDGQGAFRRIKVIPAADRYTEMRLSAPVRR